LQFASEAKPKKFCGISDHAIRVRWGYVVQKQPINWIDHIYEEPLGKGLDQGLILQASQMIARTLENIIFEDAPLAGELELR
jgi:hypothetical protein